MKWYFAMSESSIDRSDHDWRGLMRVAVKSARMNTTLVPHMLYDGVRNEFTKEMEQLGVTVIPHRVSFYDRIAEFAKNDLWHLNIASGAFLRLEIPLIETEHEFVLYTDCDVQFLKEPDLSGLRPEWFAAAPQTNIAGYDDMNSGVMLINVPAMKADLPAFLNFIDSNLHWGLLDQDVLREFYGNRYTPLNPTMNWKPYWGYNPDAKIVHWHGPKPVVAQRMMRDPRYRTGVATWDAFVELNPTGYAYYVGSWDAVSNMIVPQGLPALSLALG